MCEDDAEGGQLRVDIEEAGLVEAAFLGVHGVGSAGLEGKAGLAGVVGPELKWRYAGLGDGDVGAGDGDSVFVDGGEEDVFVRGGLLRGESQNTPRQKQAEKSPPRVFRMRHRDVVSRAVGTKLPFRHQFSAMRLN